MGQVQQRILLTMRLISHIDRRDTVETYRLEEAQDGYWRITKKTWGYGPMGQMDDMWDVVVASTTDAEFVNRRYYALIDTEAQEEARFQAEHARVWEIMETNEE